MNKMAAGAYLQSSLGGLRNRTKQSTHTPIRDWFAGLPDAKARGASLST